MYLGTWQIDDLLTFSCNTSNVTSGAAADADSVPTYRVYEDETGTAILTGSMALLDDANTVGQYSEQITLSAANGFEVGKTYTIRIAATVNSVAGATVRTFQVEVAPATLANQTTIAGYLDTEVAAILAAVDTEVAAIKAKTDNLPTDPADASDIAASFSTVNSTLATIAAYIDTEVAAIKAKTDNLPSDPADASDIAASFTSLASTLSAIAGYIDTEVAAIKAKTDNLPASPAATGDAMTLTSGERDSIAAALLDLANGVETGLTLRQAMRLIAAAEAGQLSGAATTTIVIKAAGVPGTTRITATVDADGNRSALTLNP